MHALASTVILISASQLVMIVGSSCWSVAWLALSICLYIALDLLLHALVEVRDDIGYC